MRLIDVDELRARLVDWSLCEMPEGGVNYVPGRMVTDHERQYELFLQLEDVLKEISEQEIVKAIPIAWIDSYITDSEIGIAANDPISIKIMVEDWQTEQEYIKHAEQDKPAV